MDDERIVELYFLRSEDAIAETDKKYGRYCRTVANRILRSDCEAEECVNDTYMRAWGAIPPERPRRLSSYLGRIARNLALDRCAHDRAAMRYAPYRVVLDELEEVIPDVGDADTLTDSLDLSSSLSRFLGGLPGRERRVFVQRYWYMCSVKEIAADNGMTESNVKVTLMRTRARLREYLIQRGITV